MSDAQPSCFVAMPLTTSPEAAALYNDSDHFVHVLEHLFAPAIEAAGYQVVKPIMSGADLIQAEIIKNLESADLVLADISRHNPNVFFELGIRTALDRSVALVRDSETGKLPFDTGILNTHMYDAALAPWTLGREIDALSNHIKQSAERSSGGNPLWKYFGLTQRATPDQPSGDPIEEKLDLLLTEVRRSGSSFAARQLEHHVSSEMRDRQPLATRLNWALDQTEDRPKRLRPVILQLAAEAESIHARFRVAELYKNRIVLDARPFQIEADVFERMERIALSHGLVLGVVHSEGEYGDVGPRGSAGPT